MTLPVAIRDEKISSKTYDGIKPCFYQKNTPDGGGKKQP